MSTNSSRFQRPQVARRRNPGAACLVILALVAGCSSGGNKTFDNTFTPAPLESLAPGETLTPTPPIQADPQGIPGDPPPTSYGNAPGSATGGYNPIGQMVQHWDGVIITDNWSVGPITYGSASGAPAAVLAAYNQTDASQAASIAAIPLTLTVTFQGGVTTSVLIPPNAGLQIGLVPQTNGGAYAAFTDTSGVTNWDCSDQTQSYSMTPNGHVDMTIWLIVPNVVTNGNPHPTDVRTFGSWSFGPAASIIGGGTETDSASGPNAMS